jgi:arylsulfatase A-like enzyme
MTGKYNFRNYVNFGAINPSEYTFGNLMKSAGYKTFVAGKWQLGESPDLPYKLGFDSYSLWHLNHLEQLKEQASRYRDPVIIESKGGTVATKGKYGPDIFSNRVLSFIEENKNSPFFLYYPMVLTHSPYQPTPDQANFSTFSIRKKDTAYFRYMVNYMDKIIGQIVDKVEKLGIAENTIILYTGDNGTGKDIISMMGNVAVRQDISMPAF